MILQYNTKNHDRLSLFKIIINEKNTENQIKHIYFLINTCMVSVDYTIYKMQGYHHI